jgi:hypothetical protein
MNFHPVLPIPSLNPLLITRQLSLAFRVALARQSNTWHTYLSSVESVLPTDFNQFLAWSLTEATPFSVAVRFWFSKADGIAPNIPPSGVLFRNIEGNNIASGYTNGTVPSALVQTNRCRNAL